MIEADITAVAWTAIGTIALAVVTAGAVFTTIFITRQDRKKAGALLVEERAYAAKVLAEERQAADDRLAKQLASSSAEMIAERDHARELDQEAQALAVKVIPGEQFDSMSSKILAARA